MDITPGLPETDNFQHWPPWRPLVVETARRILDYTRGTLVMPMTVLVEEYWREISTGLADHAIPVRHFVLHATRTPSADASTGTLCLALPRSVSSTSSPTPRRPAPGCTKRPTSSTPHTSRLPRPPCGSRTPSTVQPGPDGPLGQALARNTHQRHPHARADSGKSGKRRRPRRSGSSASGARGDDVLEQAEGAIFEQDLSGLSDASFEAVPAPDGPLTGSVGSLGELREAIERVSLRWRLDAVLHLYDYMG